MTFQATPKPNLGAAIGQGLGAGVGQALDQYGNRIGLTKALEGLNKPGFEEQPYTQQLSQILPALLSTPGGAQVAGELLPVLSQRSNNQNYLNYLKKTRDQRNQGDVSEKTPMGNEPEISVKVEGPQGDIATAGMRNAEEGHFRRPQAVPSPEATNPLQAMKNEAARPYSAREMQDRIVDVMESSMQTGKPISYSEASQLVNQEQANRLAQNEQLNREKAQREEFYDKRIQQGLAKARNSGLIKEEYEQPIFEKFLEEGRDSANSNEQYQQAQRKFNDYRQARDQLDRQFSAPNMATGLGRKITGTYQDKEQIMKNIQPQIKTFKRLGLIEPLREKLTTTVGLGPEDAETAIFPPPKDQRASWNKILRNTTKPRTDVYGIGDAADKIPFPGQGFEANPEQFQYLKEQIVDQLQRYPETNLLAFRGFLNQDRRYAWQDISNAFSELDQEGSLDLDQVQQQERFLINNSPLPGLSQIFEYMWSGAK